MEPYDDEPTPPGTQAEPAEPVPPIPPVPPIEPIAAVPPVPPIPPTPPDEPERPSEADQPHAEEHGPRIEIDLIQGDAILRGGAPQVLLTSPGVRAEDHIVSDVDGTLRFHRLPDDSELSVPDGARVLIRQVYGDLTVEGLDGFVTAQHIRGDLTLTGLAVGDFVHVEGDLRATNGGSLRVRIAGADVELGDYEDAPLLGHVGGDIEAHDLAGLEVRESVGGDVALERCGAVTLIGTIGGDLRAEHTSVALRASSVGGDVEISFAEGVTLAAVGGDLRIVQEASGAIEVSSVGGDADLRRTRGRVRLGTVGGDLDVEEATGGLVVGRVGGDADLDTPLTAGAEYKVRTGGDIDLRVRGEVNARFVAQAHGGEISTRLPLTVERGRRRHLVGALGRGDATVTLESGGDITITAADRFEEEHDMNDDFGTTSTTDREDEQTGPRSWETTFGGQRFRVQWDRQPGKANFKFKGPFTENDDPDAMNGGPAHDFNFEWERGKSPRFSGEYQEQINELREKAERAARKAAEQAQMYAERAAKRARDTDWEAVGREVRSAVERAMSELENAFGSMRNTWENRPSSGGSSSGTGASGQRPSGAQRVRIEVDDPDAANQAAGQAPFASRADDVEAQRRAILEQLRGGTISLDEAERQLNDLR
jgi:hypothetical protein